MTNIEPTTIVRLVENYVDKALSDAAKYDNSTPLDESGISTLHRLAADIYTAGFNDGRAAEFERAQCQRQRARE